MLGIFKRKAPTPKELADQAQRILSGECRKWDVDDYENAYLEHSKLRDLHSKTMSFGLPEEWAKLDDAKKLKLLRVIEEISQLPSSET